VNILNFRNKPVLFCSCFKRDSSPKKRKSCHHLLTLIWNLWVGDSSF